MITRLYAIYDRKAVVYHQPFYAITDAVAVRTVSDVVADPNAPFGRHPNDYVVYMVGTYDDQNGVVTPQNPLKHVIDCGAIAQAIQSEIPFPEHTTTDRPSDLDGRGMPNGKEG